jgi:hypothetical protein
MERLTNADLALIQSYSEHVRGRADAFGASITLSSDPESFAEFLGAQSNTHGVSSLHDPQKCHITRDNFAWFRIDLDGQGICCHAIRCVETDDLIEDIRTHRLFFNAEVPWDFEDVGLHDSAYELQLSGRVAIGGGLWVHPDWRGNNFSLLFSKLLRVIGIRRFRWNHYVAFVLDTSDRRGWSLQSAGQMQLHPLLNGYYPPYGRPLDIMMAYCARDALLRHIRDEMERWEQQWSDMHRPTGLQPRAAVA